MRCLELTDKIPDEHHILRLVSWARLRKDPDNDDRVIGLLPDAFRMRAGEDSLSVTWIEFFESKTFLNQIADAANAIRESMTVRTKSAFAHGNVGEIKQCCKTVGGNKIRIVHEPETDNPAHAAIRRMPTDNEDLLIEFATECWSQFTLNKDIP